MLRIKILVEPQGDASRQKTIGEIKIANITKDRTRLSSDYVWRVTEDRGDDRAGYIVDSMNVTAAALLLEVLTQWKTGLGFSLDNHGQMVSKPEGIQFTAEELWAKIDEYNSNL